MPKITVRALQARLAKVKLFLCDVDGVLTDGGLYLSAEGETKRFYIPDGLALHFLRRAGIKVGWISARPSAVTTRRAQELKIDFLTQNEHGKVAAAEAILAQAGLGFAEICYMGDDVVDLALLKRAGVAVALANGIRETKAVAHYVTKAPGGHGAVREAVELILRAQNQWQATLDHYAT